MQSPRSKQIFHDKTKDWRDETEPAHLSSADLTVDAQRTLKAAMEAVNREISDEEKLQRTVKDRLEILFNRRMALSQAISGFEKSTSQLAASGTLAGGPNTIRGIYSNTTGTNVL